MAIASLAAYKAALDQPPELCTVTFSSLATIAGRTYDLFTTIAPAGVAPTAAVVPTNATTGALSIQNGGTGDLNILASRFAGLYPGNYMICDRLSHQGGLSAIVTGAVTTNLPTAALTRYTSGVGVMIGITIYTVIGTTGTTITASYTNQAGAAAQTTPLVVFGGTGFREAGRMIMLPLAAGDTGVQSVQSITVAASTGTAGNFGVTLFKPLYTIISPDISGSMSGDFVSGYSFGGIPTVLDNACLFAMCISASVNAQGAGTLSIAEV